MGYESILLIIGSITLHIIDNARFVSFAPKIILGRRTCQDSHCTDSHILIIMVSGRGLTLSIHIFSRHLALLQT